MAQATDIVNARVQNMEFLRELRLASWQKAVADNDAMPLGAPPVQYLTAAGAVDYLLPPVADSKGLTFFIRNVSGSANTITLKDSTDAITVQAVAQNKAAIVHCDGSAWRSLSVLA